MRQDMTEVCQELTSVRQEHAMRRDVTAMGHEMLDMFAAVGRRFDEIDNSIDDRVAQRLATGEPAFC